MKIITILIEQLTDKPVLGFGAGITSGVLASVSPHDQIFQVMGNTGIVLGLIIAILTVIIRCHDFYCHFLKPKIVAVEQKAIQEVVLVESEIEKKAKAIFNKLEGKI